MCHIGQRKILTLWVHVFVLIELFALQYCPPCYFSCGSYLTAASIHFSSQAFWMIGFYSHNVLFFSVRLFSLSLVIQHLKFYTLLKNIIRGEWTLPFIVYSFTTSLIHILNNFNSIIWEGKRIMGQVHSA